MHAFHLYLCNVSVISKSFSMSTAWTLYMNKYFHYYKKKIIVYLMPVEGVFALPESKQQ